MKLMLTGATLLVSIGLSAQAPTAPRGEGGPGFDVASVKPASENRGGLVELRPGLFTISDLPVRRLILYAYAITNDQLVPTPDWTSKDRFAINARFDLGGRPMYDSKDAMRRPSAEVKAMVQRLLADRFALVVHHEERQVPIFALVVARKDGTLGRWLSRSNVDCLAWKDAMAKQQAAGVATGIGFDQSAPSPVTPDHRRNNCMTRPGPGILSGGTQSMDDLAKALERIVGRAVVDRTGLTGNFNFDIKFAQTPATTAEPDSAATPGNDASIYTAIQEQLGLKLESDKAPIDMLVVDRVEPPQPD